MFALLLRLQSKEEAERAKILAGTSFEILFAKSVSEDVKIAV